MIKVQAASVTLGECKTKIKGEIFILFQELIKIFETEELKTILKEIIYQLETEESQKLKELITKNFDKQLANYLCSIL